MKILFSVEEEPASKHVRHDECGRMCPARRRISEIHRRSPNFPNCMLQRENHGGGIAVAQESKDVPRMITVNIYGPVGPGNEAAQSVHGLQVSSRNSALDKLKLSRHLRLPRPHRMPFPGRQAREPSPLFPAPSHRASHLDLPPRFPMALDKGDHQVSVPLERSRLLNDISRTWNRNSHRSRSSPASHRLERRQGKNRNVMHTGPCFRGSLSGHALCQSTALSTSR